MYRMETIEFRVESSSFELQFELKTSSFESNFLSLVGRLLLIDQFRITVTKWIKSCLLQCFGTFKMPILMFISILVFRPEGQIWNPVRRDTRIYVRRILNASRISKTQLNYPS